MGHDKVIVPLYLEDAEGNKTEIGRVDVSDMRRKPNGFHVTMKIDDTGTELEFSAHIYNRLKPLFSIPEEEYAMGYEIDVETVGLGSKMRVVHPSHYSYDFSMGDWAREVERRSELGSSESEDSQS